MNNTNRTRAVVALAGLALIAGAAIANTTVTRAHGRFTDVDATRREGGHWRAAVLTRTNNRTGQSQEADRIEAFARHLDVSTATASTPPSFHVWMVSADTLTSADFGAMRVNRRGNAGFIFDTRRGATLPAGVTSISSFSGGTIEIRDANAGTTVLTATLP
jgi:hypothetical protein